MSFHRMLMFLESKPFLSWKKLSRVLFGICLTVFVVGFIITMFSSPWQWLGTPLTHFRRIFPNIQLRAVSRSREQRHSQIPCPNVLEGMLKGKWEQRSHSKEELDKVEKFLYIAREAHFLPYNLQRQDNRCGNVTFEGLSKARVHNLLWFRALCDPNGDLPCCYDNKCQAKPVNACVCPNCYDTRQPIHAEIAEWNPSDERCKMTYFETEDDVCKVIGGMTIYFIGDSFIRHTYTALLQTLRRNKTYGPMMEYTPKGMLMACNDQTMYLGMCMNVLDKTTQECKNTVKLKFMEYAMASHRNLMLEALDELRNASNAMLVIGIGIHDNFDAQKVTDEVITSIIHRISKFPGPKPKLLWSSMHAPGLLKTPRVPSQSKKSMFLYNQKIRQTLKKYGIPEFNTFQLTEDAVSYDGAHYGKGVNFVKSQILLNYIREIRTNTSSQNKTSLTTNQTAT